MRFKNLLAPIIVLGSVACAERDGRDECTLKAVGDQTGAHEFAAELSVPDKYMTGAEISNGGIAVSLPGCDFTLSAFLSSETVDYVIEHAPRQTLTHRDHGSRLVKARLFVWRFRDGSGHPRFFVMQTSDFGALTKPRSEQEAKRFAMPQ